MLGVELAAAIADRDRAAAAVSELQLRVVEQEEVVAGLKEDLVEAQESTATAVVAAETSAAVSREVCWWAACVGLVGELFV